MPLSDVTPGEQPTLRSAVARFQAPQLGRSLGQLATSFGGFVASSAAAHLLLGLSWWAALPFVLLAGAFLVRIFIIQHDCGHRAFLQGHRANDIVGHVCSLVTLTPYLSWRRQHAGHHGTWNNLDRRETGVDIYSSCLTVEEYRRLTPWQRRRHRLIRHPLVANILLPPLIFLLLYRLPFDMPPSWRQERRGVWLTNLALVAVYGGLGLLLGFGAVAAVQLPAMVVASILGVWLFAVQHRGEHVKWARQDDWSPTFAALEGSSYLRLPGLLQWFTGNIGFHHIHHLNPRVPNYRLEPCQRSVPQLAAIRPVSLTGALRGLHLILWDEQGDRLVTCREAAAGR